MTLVGVRIAIAARFSYRKERVRKRSQDRDLVSSRWTSVEAGAESEREGAGLLLCQTRRVLYGFVGHIINQYRSLDLFDSIKVTHGKLLSCVRYVKFIGEARYLFPKRNYTGKGQ